jgi:prevent-host-death family protein
MPRHTVGARELKVRLGTYLQRVRQGHRLVVTDRGRPVAELRPLGGEAGAEAILVALEARGVVTRPTRKRLVPFRPIGGAASQLSTAVVDGREDRF